MMRRDETPVTRPPLAGVVFDMGDIFFDATVWRRWLWRLLREMRAVDDYNELFELWDRDFLRLVHQGECLYADAFEAFLRRLGLGPLQRVEVTCASRRKKEELEQRTRLYPGVAHTLQTLREAGIPMGVLSDSESPGAALAARLERLGAGLFDVVVSSRDLGVTKPDPGAYQAICGAMKSRPESVAFVGHDDEELEGARGVGMIDIALHAPPEVAASIRLDAIMDLVPLLCGEKFSTPLGRVA